jgi:hypothetical protein
VPHGQYCTVHGNPGVRPHSRHIGAAWSFLKYCWARRVIVNCEFSHIPDRFKPVVSAQEWKKPVTKVGFKVRLIQSLQRADKRFLQQCP